jgi:hypothetical protein
VLLRAQKTVPLATVFWSNAVGYFGNYVLPARAGEVLRSGAINLKTGLPLAFVLATAATERMIDAAVLVAVVSVSISRLHRLPEWIAPALTSMAAAAAGGVVALFLLSRMGRLPEGLYRLLRLSPSARRRVDLALEDLKLGLRALQRGRPALAFFGLTAVLWCSDAAGTLVAARAFDIVLPFTGAIVYVGALGLSSAIPSAPGYVGMYQFAAVTILPLYGASRSAAFAFSVATHALNFVMLIGLGLAGIVRLRIKIGAGKDVRERRGGTP